MNYFFSIPCWAITEQIGLKKEQNAAFSKFSILIEFEKKTNNEIVNPPVTEQGTNNKQIFDHFENAWLF